MFLGTKKLWWLLALLLSIGGLVLLGGNIQPWIGGAMLLAGIVVFGAAPSEYGVKKEASREAKLAKQQAKAAAKARKSAPAAARPAAQSVAAARPVVPPAPAPAPVPAKPLDIEAADASQV